MSVLSDSAILAAMARGDIRITPMAPGAVCSNAVDVHMSLHLAEYIDDELRTDHECKIRRYVIDTQNGTVLQPGHLYLGSTVERTESGPFLPRLDGTSGAGRLGLGAHVTAGLGDVGFRGNWTLEITVVKPVRVFGGEPIGQVLFEEVVGEVLQRYDQKVGANYVDQGPLPMPSRMWRKPRFLGLDQAELLRGMSK
jgi:dCTP deaminase